MYFVKSHTLVLVVALACGSHNARCQDMPADTVNAVERWNLYWQATSIGQYHGAFHSPYEDAFSLQSYPERDVSLTTTLFLGLRLGDNTQLYFDPEIAGGEASAE